jgi:hypothetical protein
MVTAYPSERWQYALTIIYSEVFQLAAAEIAPLRIPLGTARSPAPAPSFGRLTPEMQERLMRARPLEGGRTGYGK